MNKLISLIICCALICSLLAACGRAETDKGDNAPSVTPVSGTEEAGTDEAASTTEAEEPAATTAPTATPGPTATPEPTPTPEPYNDPDGEYFNPSSSLDAKLGDRYGDVLKDAEMSIGNGYRLAKKLDAAKAGEKLTVLFIGGSVTEGASASEKTPQGYQRGYAYITYEYIRDNYGFGDGSNVEYVNVGVSGTSSALGMVRVQEDVLDYKPDLIFIEFAVNNDGGDFDRWSFESLIRRCLAAENEPAIMLLFSAATYAGGTQNYMYGIGKQYELTMMSMHNGLKKVQADKVIAWSDFSGDSVHPNQKGHYLYAKAICRVLKHAYEKNTADGYAINTEIYGKRGDLFENMKILNNTDPNGFIKDRGCFAAAETSFFSTGRSDTHAMEKGWKKPADSGAGTMKIKLACDTFVIVPMQTNSKTTVTVDVFIDGEYVQSIETSKDGAWNNAAPALVLCAEETAEHTIEIRTNETSENASVTILAMGYTAN